MKDKGNLRYFNVRTKNISIKITYKKEIIESRKQRSNVGIRPIKSTYKRTRRKCRNRSEGSIMLLLSVYNEKREQEKRQ